MVDIMSALVGFAIAYVVACLFFRVATMGDFGARRARGIFAFVANVVGCAFILFSTERLTGIRPDIAGAIVKVAVWAVLCVCLCLYGRRVKPSADAQQDVSIIPDSVQREKTVDGSEVKVYHHTEDIEALRERLTREK